MFWYDAGIFILIATTTTGCASAPTGAESEIDANQAVDIEGAITEKPFERIDYADDDYPPYAAGCRKEATTGTHVKRLTCKPAKDDSELIPLISAPRH